MSAGVACADFRPLAWDSHLCRCGAMAEIHEPKARGIARHIDQEVGSDGFVWEGFDLAYYPIGEVDLTIEWDVPTDSRRISIAQAEQLRDALTEILERVPPKQDPKADAEEDALYRAAIARVEAAEAREDRADAAAKGTTGEPSARALDRGRAADAFHAHLDRCAQCERAPFDLCPVGQQLIARVGAL